MQLFVYHTYKFHTFTLRTRLFILCNVYKDVQRVLRFRYYLKNKHTLSRLAGEQQQQQQCGS